jgi:hypothetical protein
MARNGLEESLRFSLTSERLSYNLSRWSGEKEPLGEGGSPLDSGEGWIERTLTDGGALRDLQSQVQGRAP